VSVDDKHDVGLDQERRVLITGAAGFVAPYVIERLRDQISKNLTIVGTARQSDPQSSGRSHTALDVTDAPAVRATIRDVRPTHVVHLAGLAAPQKAGAAPDLAWDANLRGSLNVARAIMAEAPDATMIFAGSGLVYGDTALLNRPLRETDLLQPNNDYAATKAAADLALGALSRQGLRVIRCRPFNHSGPGQSEDFVLPSFAAQIARIERGLQPPVLSVGNLDAERDFLDVRDVADAYTRCVIQSARLAPGTIFNIASGEPTSIRTILGQMIGFASVPVEIAIDPARWRPNDIASITGDASVARRELGWAPAHDSRALAEALLGAARQMYRAS
jgi:GDP-4-dehydro-6-deoxy-D-mannose reductase